MQHAQHFTLGQVRWVDTVLASCEANMDAMLGDLKSWDGKAAWLLLNKIKEIHGRFWNCSDPENELDKAFVLSELNPSALLWNSFFIRRLCLSVLALDVGIYHTRNISRGDVI